MKRAATTCLGFILTLALLVALHSVPAHAETGYSAGSDGSGSTQQTEGIALGDEDYGTAEGPLGSGVATESDVNHIQQGAEYEEPALAQAQGLPPTILSFAVLETLYRPLGTARESLPLPSVLEAVATDSDEATGSLFIPVESWYCPDYDPAVAACYRFTPQIGEPSLSLAERVTPPVLTVVLEDVSAGQLSYSSTILTYMDAEGVHSVAATPITNGTTALSGADTDGWYYVEGTVTLLQPLTISGDVKIILTDNCFLAADQSGNAACGISTGGSNNVLSLYAQSAGDAMGKLVAKGGIECPGIDVSLGNTINIFGGSIDATGGRAAAGIGSVAFSSAGTIAISGGSVQATGGVWGAGIGGGLKGHSGNITISNTANVTAYGGKQGAGIGAGADNSGGGKITITGGKVKATAGTWSAGIGGERGVGNDISIGGTAVVTATGSMDGAGIGGSVFCGGGKIAIWGGTVTATSGELAQGIGDGGEPVSATYFTTANGEQPGNAFILASSISGTSGKESWSGVIFEGDNGLVYGNPTLKTDAHIPSGKTLLIEEDRTLTIQNDACLTNGGTIMKLGELIGAGALPGVILPDLQGEVRVLGTPQMGQTVTAFMVTISSQPLLRNPGPLSYQWARNGTAISGATQERYTLAHEDIGSKISVTVTARKCSGSLTDRTGIVTEQEQPAPAAFELQIETVASNCYTVRIPAEAGAEYSFDGIHWSSNNSKTHCLPGATIAGFKRMAAKPGYQPSAATSAVLTLPLFQVQRPAASLPGGPYAGARTVVLTCPTDGAFIHYTLDGSPPTAASPLYTSPLIISQNTQLRAIAIKSGMQTSDVLSVAYTISSDYSNPLSLGCRITVSASPSQWGTVSGGGTIKKGDNCTVTATPHDGYQFVGWTEGDAQVSPERRYTFTAVGNRTVVAQFVKLRKTRDTGSAAQAAYVFQTLTDPDSGVCVSGYFSPGAKMVVTENLLHPTGSCRVCDAIRAHSEAGEALAVFDIAVKGSYSGQLTISIPVGAEHSGKTAEIHHCADKTLEKRTLTINDGMASGGFDSLSGFGVVGTNANLPEPAGAAGPDTNGNSNQIPAPSAAGFPPNTGTETSQDGDKKMAALPVILFLAIVIAAATGVLAYKKRQPPKQ